MRKKKTHRVVLKKLRVIVNGRTVYMPCLCFAMDLVRKHFEERGIVYPIVYDGSRGTPVELKRLNCNTIYTG